MPKILPAIAAAATVLLALGACSSDTGTGGSDGGTWTVLTYSLADTNLEEYMMDDLDELGSVGSQEGLDLVALVDRSSEFTDTDVLGLDDWTGGKLLHVGGDGTEVLEDLGDINTGDPSLLADFITRGMTDYPADHYSLIISDHGASWPGVGDDGSSEGDSLTLAEIHEGIAAGLEGAGVEKLDLLGFDACLMATYEVASELAPVADRLVASQELEPGHGWDYTAFEVLAQGADVDQLASEIIDRFKGQADDQGTQAEITLSEIDLTRMSTVDAALADFTGVLVEQAAGIGPTVGRTLAQTLGFGNNPDPTQDTHMTDLSIFTSQIGVDLLFASDAADALTRAINDAVLDRVDGQATLGATGMSIYFPPAETYFDTDYLALADSGGWQDFLTTYYGRGAQIESPPVLDDDAQIEFDDDGVTITASFGSDTADNLASAYIRYGVQESDGSVTYLGEESADLFGDDAGTASGSYDLTTLTLSDGVDTVDGYLSLYITDDGLATADVPLSYYAPDGSYSGDLLLSAIIDPDAEQTISTTFYEFDPEAGTYGEFAPEPDWIISPTVLNVLADGTEQWLDTTEVGLYADIDNIVYDLPALPSGTELYLELVVVDFGGNTASVNAVVEVP